MRIGSDLDGVGYVFRDSCYRYGDSIGYVFPPRPEPGQAYNFEEAWGMNREQFREFTNAGVDAGYIFSGPAMLGFAYAMWLIRKAGNTIHIITHRYQGSPGAAEKATLKWLEQNYVKYDSITFSEDKTVVPTDMFVEDNIANYDALVACGVDAYLVNRPWNQQVDTRKRVNDVVEFANIVVEKSRALR